MENVNANSSLNICAATRVKNGARYMEEHLSAVLKVCNHALVLDDHSTDNTISICQQFAPRVETFSNPSDFLNEAGDKNVLIAELRSRLNPDWCLLLDADEILLDPAFLVANIISGRAPAYTLHIWSCWNDPEHVRTDGIYGRCWRASCFDMGATNGRWVERSATGPNLHCNNIPQDLQFRARPCQPEVRVKHYGYMLREDRIRKYHWYHDIDPQGLYLDGEDGYRHSVQGDMPEFPAEARYRHGGPLTIVPFPAQSLNY